MSLTDLEERACAAIAVRQVSMLEQLAQHVALPTGLNHVSGLHAYRELVSKKLQSLGASLQLVPGTPKAPWLTLPGTHNGLPSEGTHNIPSTLVCHHRTGEQTPRVLLAGHLDTVHNPHGSFRELKIADDGKTAIGPGVVDMKGGIVIAINALEALAECGVKLNWTFLLNSDEETGSFHSFDAITNAAREHDIGIALEPALPDGSLVIERMGSGQMKIEVFGLAAHVGREYTRGVSAVNELAKIITQLSALSDPSRGLIVNIGPLQGSSATNVVADYAACWGNVRFANQHAIEIFNQQIDILQSKSDSLPRIVVHRLFNRPAKPCTHAVRHLAETTRALASELNQHMPFASTGGVCDGNIMQAAGLPTLDTLGVRGGNLHRPDEFIELSSLVERCQLLAVLLIRIAS